MYALGLPATVRKRSTLYLTSSDVSSRPFTGGLLCQRTPRRSLKTYVVSFGCVHDSARSGSIANVPGTTDGPALCFTRRLCVKVSGICTRYAVVSIGSKSGGSQPRTVRDRKSTRLNSSHTVISYAVF